MIRSYKLDGRTPVLCDDFLDSAQWMQTADRHVAQTYIRDIYISTVFLGFDHGFGDGPPVLFETMVFGGSLDQEMDRYCTWEEAEAGHEIMTWRVMESEKWHNRMIFILKQIFSWFHTKVTLVTNKYKMWRSNRNFSKNLK